MKKKYIIISIMLIIIAMGVYSYIILECDVLKSNREIFYKYLIKENLKSIEDINISKYKEILSENQNYSIDIDGKSDSLNEILNLEKELSLSSKVISDKNNKNFLLNIDIMNGENSLTKLNYLRNGEKRGIKYDNVTEENYITWEDKDVNEIFSKLLIKEIPDVVQIWTRLENLENVKINIRKAREIEKKYLEVINKIATEDKFVLEKSVSINMNNEERKADRYVLKITEKELYDIIDSILINLKGDVDTIEFYIDTFDKSLNIKQAIEEIEKLKQNFEETKVYYNENEYIEFAIYVYNGKNVKNEIVSETGRSLAFSLFTNDQSEKEIKFEINDVDVEQEGSYIGNITELSLKEKKENERINLSFGLKQIYNLNDIKKIEPTENKFFYDTNICCNLTLDKIYTDNIKISGNILSNENEIFDFKGKIEKNIKEMTIPTLENTININNYNDIDLRKFTFEVFEKSILNILDKSEQIVPGSTIIVSNFLSNIGVGSTNATMNDLTRILGNTKTSEVNRALVRCIDDYAKAYSFDNTSTIDKYLTEENVKKYCEDAKSIKFTDDGIEYISNDGKIYEGKIDTTLETGYILVIEMEEKK